MLLRSRARSVVCMLLKVATMRHAGSFCRTRWSEASLVASMPQVRLRSGSKSAQMKATGEGKPTLLSRLYAILDMVYASRPGAAIHCRVHQVPSKRALNRAR